MKAFSIRKISNYGFFIIILGSIVSALILILSLFRLESIKENLIVIQNTHKSFLELKNSTERLLTTSDIKNSLNSFKNASIQFDKKLDDLKIEHATDIDDLWYICQNEVKKIDDILSQPTFNAKNIKDKPLLHRRGELFMKNDSEGFYFLLNNVTDSIEYLIQNETFILNLFDDLNTQYKLQEQVKLKNTKNFVVIFPFLILVFTILLASYISKTARDIEKEMIEKEQILFQQSKMASMGEMIGNIAHQWRQPIAIISMWANNIIADIDMDTIENENLKKYAKNINEQTNHLSKTIDDFRNFFIPNKEKTIFTITNSIENTMKLLSASFKTHNIEVIKDIKDIEIKALENELTQAILNIIKNAKDILVTLPNEKRKLLFINIYKDGKNAMVEIKDNGGGVSKNIINKIFEPYFTTKHKSQGTGIGLYMTETIITKHLNGEVTVTNVKFNYEDDEYIGASFLLKIPCKG
jgi:signal transduction histidine kinase